MSNLQVILMKYFITVWIVTPLYRDLYLVIDSCILMMQWPFELLTGSHLFSTRHIRIPKKAMIKLSEIYGHCDRFRFAVIEPRPQSPYNNDELDGQICPWHAHYIARSFSKKRKMVGNKKWPVWTAVSRCTCIYSFMSNIRISVSNPIADHHQRPHQKPVHGSASARIARPERH